MQPIKCAWADCDAVSETPGSPGWRYLSDWPPPIVDGLYCPIHAAAIEPEAFDDPDEDPDDDDDDDDLDDDDDGSDEDDDDDDDGGDDGGGDDAIPPQPTA